MDEQTDKDQAKKKKLTSPETSETKSEGQWISKGYSAAPKIRPRQKVE